MSGASSMHWKGKKMHTKFWSGKLKGREPLGRLRCGWDDNTKMDPRKVWSGFIWIGI